MMLLCNSCGSSIPEELWKDENGSLKCPVCGALLGKTAVDSSDDKAVVEKEDTIPVKVSLAKDDNTTVVPVELPVSPNSEVTAESIFDSIDKGIRNVFGSSVEVCPNCGKVICICSLKKLLSGDKNNAGF